MTKECGVETGMRLQSGLRTAYYELLTQTVHALLTEVVLGPPFVMFAA